MKQRVNYWINAIHWYFNGKTHRNDDLPALYYFESNKILSVSYRQHSKYHRTTGPAIIYYRDKNKKYYYHGKRYASLEKMLMVEACR